jgi:hypothetical protein
MISNSPQYTTIYHKYQRNQNLVRYNVEPCVCLVIIDDNIATQSDFMTEYIRQPKMVSGWAANRCKG